MLTKKQIKLRLKYCTSNQLQQICDLLYLNYELLKNRYLSRYRLLDLEYILNMSVTKIQKELDFAIERIQNGLCDSDIAPKLEQLLNINISNL